MSTTGQAFMAGTRGWRAAWRALALGLMLAVVSEDAGSLELTEGGYYKMQRMAVTSALAKRSAGAPLSYGERCATPSTYVPNNGGQPVIDVGDDYLSCALSYRSQLLPASLDVYLQVYQYPVQLPLSQYDRYEDIGSGYWWSVAWKDRSGNERLYIQGGTGVYSCPSFDRPIWDAAERACYCPGVNRGGYCYPAITTELMIEQDFPATGSEIRMEPNQGVPLVVRAVDSLGNPSPLLELRVGIEVDSASGGHVHGAGDTRRPPGSLGPQSVTPVELRGQTDERGEFRFIYTAPSVSGDYMVSASCANPGCNPASKSIWVGIEGLIPLPPSQHYGLIGSLPEHPANHYMTVRAASRMVVLASLYREKFPGIEHPMQINDASLERGGLFDIPGNWLYRNSQGKRIGHVEHRRGVVADVRANAEYGAIPKEYDRAFVALIKSLFPDATTEIHSPDTSNRHHHVRIMGLSQ